MTAWILTRLLTPTGVLAALLAAVSVYSVVVTKMYGGANDRYHQLKESVRENNQLAERQARYLRDAQEGILARYASGWESALSAANSRPRIRVLPGAECHERPTLSTTTGEVQRVPTSSEGVRSISVEQCERLANKSLLDAKWIEDVKEITDKLSEASK